MIVVESERNRNFVGRLETGSELIESIRDYCVRERIETAFFQGFGYVKNPTIQVFRPDQKRYVKAPRKVEGDFLATTIRGSVSFRQDARELNVVAVMTNTESGEGLAGELVEAEVISFEFSVVTYDDVRLFRDKDDKTGLRQWVMLELLKSPDDEKVKSDADKPSKSVEQAEEAAKASQVEVSVGDILEHPKLGDCEIVELAGDDRIVIRLMTGRVVELHRGIVELELIGERDGNRVLRVSVRRKKK